jgi:uncharacterized membrane protein
MVLAALSSFWLTGLRDGLSLIHLLSVWTVIALAHWRSTSAAAT